MHPAEHTPKLLRCIATDGSMVWEGSFLQPFPDTDAAWRRASDMGSRWFFYPIHVVTSLRGFIADVPNGMSDLWIGKSVYTLARAIEDNQGHACDYIAGRCPFELLP